MKLILKAVFAGFFLFVLVSFLNSESSGLVTQANDNKDTHGVIAEFNNETVKESPLLPKTNKSFASQSSVVNSTNKRHIATGSNKVESIGFGVQGLIGIVTIKTTVPVKFEELPKGEKRLNLKLLDVFLPEEFQVSRDVNEFGSPVSFISTFKDLAGEGDVIVIVELKEDARTELNQQDNVLTLRFTKQSGEETIKVSEKTQVEESQPTSNQSAPIEGVAADSKQAEPAEKIEESPPTTIKAPETHPTIQTSSSKEAVNPVIKQEEATKQVEESKAPQKTQIAESQPSTQSNSSKETVDTSYKEENTPKVIEGDVLPTTTLMVESQPSTQSFPSGAPGSASLNTVESIGFEVKEGVGIVAIKTSAPVTYEELPKEEKKLNINLQDVFLPEEFQVSRDVSDFDSPVRFISSFRDPVIARRVIIVLELKEDAPVVVKQEGNFITVNIGTPKGEEEITDGLQPVPEGPLYAFDFRIATTPGAKKVYRGQLVSFDFKDADVRDVLKILADISGFNFIVSRDVKGTVTLKLSNVPWDLALDIVLEDATLGAVVEGNVIKVAPLKTIQAKQIAIRSAAQSKEQLEPLITKQIFINYATADELTPLADPLLSQRGDIKVDTRTNSILVTDTASRVRQIEELVKSLDTRTPQVLIESRIVQATLDFTRELGVQWGVDYKASAATGNPTGATFPSSINAGGTNIGAPFGTQGNNFIVDLPAAVGTGSGGAIGIVLGSLSGAFDLDIRLSALENRGDGRVLSSPRVLTLNNNPARIEQGVSIPFLSVSAAGTQTQFVDANLTLDVTPQVTNDNRILMDIKVTDNRPDPTLTGANGQPSIRRNEAETQTIASDGETIVIGGIYTRETSESLRGIPWFNRIPLLGWLFRTERNIDSRRELIIFVTPRIVK
ncbi:MAG TPA: type IV pilus secretin PilQ [Thermodesulfobacteriota bacterium]|nr:type IV pilus secretin PilQ [Thermodesulfobacteriota bacterium]